MDKSFEALRAWKGRQELEQPMHPLSERTAELKTLRFLDKDRGKVEDAVSRLGTWTRTWRRPKSA